jgi:hypothetical protein
MSGPLARQIFPVMSDLRTLRVQLSYERSPIGDFTADTEAFSDLQVLLKHTPLLECLQLHFGLDDSTVPGNFVTWLSQTQSTSAGVRESAKLPYLNSLELGALKVAPRALLDIVSKFPTLVSASFREILLDDDCSDEHVENLWPKFLLELADRVQCQGAVRAVSIHHPAYRHPQCSLPVYFLTHSSSDRSTLEQVPRYKTDASCDARSPSHVCFWLRELATRTYHPQDYTDAYALSGDDSDSDQSSDDDDSDESVASGRSNRRALIERMVATTMYEFSTL